MIQDVHFYKSFTLINRLKTYHAKKFYSLIFMKKFNNIVEKEISRRNIALGYKVFKLFVLRPLHFEFSRVSGFRILIFD